MALLLSHCTAPPESLHQLATLRQRLSVQQNRSRRSARAKHGATESTSKTQATSNDHIKIASTEPCCTISSLVMVPRKPTRRSSRLRAKKGREGAKTGTVEDMEVAEWVNQVLANNGMVEVDPVTMAELSGGKPDTTNTHHRIASLTTSSEVPDYFPPRGPAHPRFPRVPFEVAIAAVSAVALAIIAAILNAISNQRIEAKPSQSDSEGNYLGSDFAGEPVKSSNGANPPQLTKDKKLPVDVMASTAGASAGAAILTAFDKQPGSVKTGLDYSAMPLPPSLSKNRSKRDSPPHEQQRKWDSVTPFFTSHRSSESYPRPTPSNSTWSEEKYKSVAPFFPSDRSATNGSSLKSATPFFADEQQGVESQNGTSLESVTPFFPDDQGRGLKNEPSLEAVTPFFADDQGSESKNGISLENVTPFFADNQGSESKNGISLENVTSFFADDQGSESKNGISLENVTPFFADEQGRSSTGMSQSKSSYQNVKPFFPDDRVGRSEVVGETPISGFRGQPGVSNGESNEAMRDSLADRMANLRGETPVNSSQFATIPDDLVRSQDQHRQFMEGTTADRLAAEMRNGSSFGDKSVGRPLSPEELALLEEIKEEEAKQHAKFQALQAAFPALAIGAGAVGALVGVDGAFEMVGLTATASFISYELLWANKRKELLDEISTITDHHKLFRFLQKRKIVKDDC